MGCACSNTVTPLAPSESVVNCTHFKISQLIGKGGFGEVRLVIKLTGVDEGTTYAMKVYKKRVLMKHQSGVKEVMWELSMLATLKSPWICNARYAFQDEAHCYMVMDLALGGDLKYRLGEEQQLAEGRVRIYLAQIYLALEYLHSKKVLHRDVKPANIVLDTDGYIKVTDMGISAHLNSNNICTKGNGTPSFMAPELYTTTREHSFPSDWWSYGILAHHLLCARDPFKRNAFRKDGDIVVATGELEKDAPSFPTPSLYFKEGTAPSRQSSSAAPLKKKDDSSTETDDAVVAAADAAAAAADAEADVAAQRQKKGGTRHKKRGVTVSPECALFVAQLLQKNPANRLGAKSSQEVKNHPFFAGFDWEALKARTLPVPFVPDITKENFCMENDILAEVMEMDDLYVVPEKDKSKFDDSHFNTALSAGAEKDGSGAFRARLRGQFPSMRFESASRRRVSSLLSSGGSGATMDRPSKSSSETGSRSVAALDRVQEGREEEAPGGGVDGKTENVSGGFITYFSTSKGAPLFESVSRRILSLVSLAGSSKDPSTGLPDPSTTIVRGQEVEEAEERGGIVEKVVGGDAVDIWERGVPSSRSSSSSSNSRTGDDERQEDVVSSAPPPLDPDSTVGLLVDTKNNIMIVGGDPGNIAARDPSPVQQEE